MEQGNKTASNKVRFSIGNKLRLIIACFVLVSLGSFTALVWHFNYGDLVLNGEKTNLGFNRRCAMEAEMTLKNICFNSGIMIQAVTAIGRETAAASQTINYFFSENPHIGAVLYIDSKEDEFFFINDLFFVNMNKSFAESFFKGQSSSLNRAIEGETFLNNASPYFPFPCLVMFFPAGDGDAESGAAAVLFTVNDLNNNFGIDQNQSILVNGSGDILAASDISLIQSGKNLASEEYFIKIKTNTRFSKQEIIKADLSFLNASYEPINTGFTFSIRRKAQKAGLSALKIYDSAIERASSYIPALKNMERKNIDSIYLVTYTKLGIADGIVITSINQNNLVNDITSIVILNICLTIAVLVVFIYLISLFGKTITIPVNKLSLQVKKIALGEFDQSFNLPKRKDEIGILQDNFLKMNNALNVYKKYPDKKIARNVMNDEIKEGGFSKNAVILCSEIKDFKSLQNQFTMIFGSKAPEKFVPWLNEYLNKMNKCVEDCNGVQDRISGEEITAHWGTAFTGGSLRKDIFGCVKAALMMRKALFLLNSEKDEYSKGDPRISFGCGIHSGMVTAGLMGSDERMEYKILGEPVILAKKMKSFARQLGVDILISEDVWDIIGNKLLTEEMPSLSVKGKNKPVRIFAVINYAGDYKGPQNLKELRRVLGIREKDLNKDITDTEEEIYKLNKLPDDLSDIPDLIDIDIDVDF